MNKFLKRAMELNESIQCDRQFIHQNAELGNDLPITSGYVKKRLEEMGLEPKEICKCGITALIKGKKPGKTYLLRADMDALLTFVLLLKPLHYGYHVHSYELHLF